MYVSIVPWRLRWSSVMFKMAETLGWKSRTVSSWKEDTSTTRRSLALSSGITWVMGRPMLPTQKLRKPAFLKTSPSRVTVVLLPFVPVMAT